MFLANEKLRYIYSVVKELMHLRDGYKICYLIVMDP